MFEKTISILRARVILQKQQTAQGERRYANPDVESRFSKEQGNDYRQCNTGIDKTLQMGSAFSGALAIYR